MCWLRRQLKRSFLAQIDLARFWWMCHWMQLWNLERFRVCCLPLGLTFWTCWASTPEKSSFCGFIQHEVNQTNMQRPNFYSLRFTIKVPCQSSTVFCCKQLSCALSRQSRWIELQGVLWVSKWMEWPEFNHLQLSRFAAILKEIQQGAELEERK